MTGASAATLCQNPQQQPQQQQQQQQPNIHEAVILFYKYLDPRKSHSCWLIHQFPEFYLDKILQFQKDLGARLGLKGRVLLASEGINATLSAPSSEILKEYRHAMESFDVIAYCGIPADDANNHHHHDENPDNLNYHKSSNSNDDYSPFIFRNIDWKESFLSPKSGSKIAEPFPDLKISIVKELVSTGGNVSVEDISKFGGTHLTPEEFHQILTQQQQQQQQSELSNDDNNSQNSDDSRKATEIVLIDVRNTFEFDIGHFVNPNTQEPAWNPEMVTFSSFDPQFCQQYAPQLQDKTVLMYCTGGIRCEKATVMLKKRGVQTVYQLAGGIHRYLETFGEAGCFRGRNFQFDQRVSLTPAEHYEQQHRQLDDYNGSGQSDPNTEHPKSSSAAAVGQSTIVGKCVECAAPFDEISGSRLCTVCRDLVLVCPNCQAKLREYHCRRHAAWKTCYLTFLEVFDKQQLESHERQLNELLLQQTYPKNVRRTLHRQVEKIQQRKKEIEKCPELVDPNAPRRCRTCREPNTICNGLCWGFWKTTTIPEPQQHQEATIANSTTTDSLTADPILPIRVGDKVCPGPDWNEIRFGKPNHPTTGCPLEGTVVELKNWGAGSTEQDCVAVQWDDVDALPRRRQPQVYRWGARALNGKRMYDVQQCP